MNQHTMEVRPQIVPEPYGSPLALSSFLLLSIIFIIHRLWPQDNSVPTVLKKEIPSRLRRQNYFYHNARSTLATGYKNFPNQTWRLDTPSGHRLVLPVSLLDELKSHPAVSLNAATDHIFMKELTGLGGQAPHKLQLFKSKITPSLPRYAPILHEIIRNEIPVLFNAQSDWTSATVQDKLASLVSKTAARVFHGEQASRDEEWLRLAPQYVDTLMEYIGILRAWPSFLRPLVALFTKQRGEVARLWQQGSTIIEQSLNSGVENDPPSLLDLSRDQPLSEIVETQMAMVIAGVLTTAATCTHILLDIAAHPEAIAELREEIKEVYDSCGGTLDRKSLGKLERLDSWMKESIRLNNADMSKLTPSTPASIQRLTCNQQPSNAKPPNPSPSQPASPSPRTQPSRSPSMPSKPMKQTSPTLSTSTAFGSINCDRHRVVNQDIRLWPLVNRILRGDMVDMRVRGGGWLRCRLR